MHTGKQSCLGIELPELSLTCFDRATVVETKHGGARVGATVPTHAAESFGESGDRRTKPL